MRSNDNFNFSLEWIKYTVIVVTISLTVLVSVLTHAVGAWLDKNWLQKIKLTILLSKCYDLEITPRLPERQCKQVELSEGYNCLEFEQILAFFCLYPDHTPTGNTIYKKITLQITHKLTYLVNNLHQFLQLIRADIRTVCKAKVEHDPLSQVVPIGHLLRFCSHQLPVTAQQGFPQHFTALLGNGCTSHTVIKTTSVVKTHFTQIPSHNLC